MTADLDNHVFDTSEYVELEPSELRQQLREARAEADRLKGTLRKMVFAVDRPGNSIDVRTYMEAVEAMAGKPDPHDALLKQMAEALRAIAGGEVFEVPQVQAVARTALAAYEGMVKV